MSDTHLRRYDLLASFPQEDIETFMSDLVSDRAALIEGGGEALSVVHVVKLKRGNPCDGELETPLGQMELEHFDVYLRRIVDEELELQRAPGTVSISNGVQAMVSSLVVRPSLGIQPQPPNRFLRKPSRKHPFTLPTLSLYLGESLSPLRTANDRGLSRCEDCLEPVIL